MIDSRRRILRLSLEPANRLVGLSVVVQFPNHIFSRI
jgi:hypothetical protein